MNEKTLGIIISRLESLLNEVKEMRGKSRPVEFYNHHICWANKDVSHACFDGKKAFLVDKKGNKRSNPIWLKETVDAFVRGGYWIKIEQPKSARKFKHRDGYYYDDGPFKYVEIKDGKFYKVLKNGHRKELTTAWKLEEIDGFINDGYWIEVK